MFKKLIFIAIGTSSLLYSDPGITIEVDVFYPEGPAEPKPFEPGHPGITGIS